MREEIILISSLALVLVSAVLSVLVLEGVLASMLLASTVGLAGSAGKLAFDSIVQRDAPDANRGRSFARFETRFQILWVIGAATRGHPDEPRARVRDRPLRGLVRDVHLRRGVVGGPAAIQWPTHGGDRRRDRGRGAHVGDVRCGEEAGRQHRTFDVVSGPLARRATVESLNVPDRHRRPEVGRRSVGLGQVDPSEPEPGRVDLGDGRQVVRGRPEAVEALVACPLDDPGGERVSPIAQVLAELEPEQPGGEAVGVRLGDPAAPEALR